jgi:hypothetical protein
MWKMSERAASLAKYSFVKKNKEQVNPEPRWYKSGNVERIRVEITATDRIILEIL